MPENLRAVKPRFWTYPRAIVLAVHDGDSLDLRIDQGFRQFHEDTFRLAGIDADELDSSDPEKKAKAIAAQQWLQERLPVGSIVPVTTELDRRYRDKKEKYGRYLVHIMKDGPNEPSLNYHMIRLGLVRAYEGGARAMQKGNEG